MKEKIILFRSYDKQGRLTGKVEKTRGGNFKVAIIDWFNETNHDLHSISYTYGFKHFSKANCYLSNFASKKIYLTTTGRLTKEEVLKMFNKT